MISAVSNTMENLSSTRQCKVLIVEDERHIARLLDHILRKEGYAVQVAPDAEQALLSVAESKPDAVLLDIGLPGMSGLEFLRRIRHDAFWKDLVVIVLSAHWFQQDDQTIADAGATAQCPKPIAPSKLIGKLRDCGMTALLTIPDDFSSVAV